MFLSQTLILWTKRAYRSGIFKLLSGWVKIHQISYILFKARSQSSLNFASLVRAMIDNSSVLFQLKLYMIWRIWAHQSPKLQTFNCSLKISRNLHFDSRFLLLKVYKPEKLHVSHKTVNLGSARSRILRLPLSQNFTWMKIAFPPHSV